MKYREVFIKNVQFLIREKTINGKKYTKKDVEEMCGVSEGYIGRKGSRYSFELLCKLAILYGITIDELMGCDLATQGINSKSIYNLLVKLKADTKERLIEWNIYNNLFEAFEGMKNPFEVDMDSDNEIYKRYFEDNSGRYGKLIGNAYVGDGYGKKIVLLRVSVEDVEGWELYVINYENEYELARPVGMFHALGDGDRVLVNKIYDLLLNIELSKRDIHISKDARAEISSYMEDAISEIPIYHYSCPD